MAPRTTTKNGAVSPISTSTSPFVVCRRRPWAAIRWICASNDGTSKAGNAVSDFPGYKASSFFDKLPSNLKQFYPILQTTMHHRPVTPAEDYYVGQLLNEVSNALYGKKTPKKALDDVTKTSIGPYNRARARRMTRRRLKGGTMAISRRICSGLDTDVRSVRSHRMQARKVSTVVRVAPPIKPSAFPSRSIKHPRTRGS